MLLYIAGEFSINTERLNLKMVSDIVLHGLPEDPDERVVLACKNDVFFKLYMVNEDSDAPRLLSRGFQIGFWPYIPGLKSPGVLRPINKLGMFLSGFSD